MAGDFDGDLDEENELRRLEGLPALAPAPPPPPVAPPAASSSSAAAGPDDPMGPLADGGLTTVAGSGASVYTIKRTGDSYYCSCPAWKNQSGAGTMRTCKHLKALRGEEEEKTRLLANK